MNIILLNSLFFGYFFISIFEYGCINCKKEGNIYSAIAHMEPLVEIERRLIRLARTYVDKERHKLNGLKQFAQQVDEALKLSKDEPIKYLGNPINSYLIIKRFTSGWADLANRLTVDDEHVEDIRTLLVANDMYLPTQETDVPGATQAIFRLQDTYNITSREIADGRIKGVRPSAHQLSANDCLDIADVGHRSQRYFRMKEWLNEAERILNDPMLQHRRGDINEKDLYEYLAWGNYLSGDMSNALKYTNKILEIDPSYENALNNRDFYKFYEIENTERWLTTEQWDYNEAMKNDKLYLESSLATLCRETLEPVSCQNVSNIPKYVYDPTYKHALDNKKIYTYYVEKNLPITDKEATFVNQSQAVLNNFINSSYVKSCREINPTATLVKNAQNLKSFYHSNSPRYYLQPAKVTQVHDNPEIYIFHDLLYEWEIRKLKEIATPRLTPAKVIDQDNEKHVTANYRVSKNLFFDSVFPEDKNISVYIDKRLEEITQLSMKYAENLQCNNYGLGGQYEFHIDHGPPGSYLDNHPNGNRIATLLFYLSNVEKGGQTVFTKLGLSMHPKKGDAVFWYNLFRNGTGNFNTQHASCPVLSGSKWVVNKWVHTHGNEFKRPCTLNQFE